MKPHPMIVFAIATVTIAQVPTRPPLTEDSAVIVTLLRRNADTALLGAAFFPARADYFQGQHDALIEASLWIQDFLPRESLPITPTAPEPKPPRDFPPKKGNAP